MSDNRFNLWSFRDRFKVLHLSWIAFFITFVVWFNHAPLMQAIAASLGLTPEQMKTLLILNVALTIPARVVVGALTDKFGPRIVYSALLAICAIPCFAFALAEHALEPLAVVFGTRILGVRSPPAAHGVAPAGRDRGRRVLAHLHDAAIRGLVATARGQLFLNDLLQFVIVQMRHISAFAKKNSMLANIAAMIANPLQCFGHIGNLQTHTDLL